MLVEAPLSTNSANIKVFLWCVTVQHCQHYHIKLDASLLSPSNVRFVALAHVISIITILGHRKNNN